MKITSNYAINNSSNDASKCGKPSFGASVSSDTMSLLISAAKKSNDTNALHKLSAQLINIFGWGAKGSTLERSVNMQNMTDSFSLSNASISKYYEGNLGVNPNDSLLKQFFSLTEEKILKAEEDIKGLVKDSRSKAAAVLKEKYPNMSQNELETVVNKMSESRIMDLIFPADAEAVSHNGLINFVI